MSLSISHPTDMSYNVDQGLLVSTQIVVSASPNCEQTSSINYSVELNGATIQNPDFVPAIYMNGSRFGV